MNIEKIIMMKPFLAMAMFTALLCLTLNGLSAQQPLIIPQPQTMQVTAGTFGINKSIVIAADHSFTEEAKFLADTLKQTADVNAAYNSKGNILFIQVPKTDIKDEGYTLEVLSNRIVIKASSKAGAFYAVQTIIQMLPAEVSAGKKVSLPLSLPTVKISDAPRFAWRAFMLDEGRHFKGETEVKKLLDQMAMLKMNVFHWHLTDDQGWRIEIKKYPKLTTIGSKRTDTQIGGWNSPKRSGEAHAGFYTQEQIRDIVNYAADRHITIVPEIGMPGHASAAIASYPILGTTGKEIPVMTVFGKAYDTYNPARESTYQILSEILDEVCELFPSKIIHIGGDEVRFTQWQESEEVKALMERENLKTMADVQTYFTNRMSQIVAAKGRRIMGWNEIMGEDLHGFLKDGQTGQAATLSTDAVVHFWKGSAALATKAIKKGHDVINSWDSYTYLDYNYSSISLHKAYHFDPIIPGLEPQYHSAIKGFGCQMWGEWIPTVERMESRVYPRIAAFAEVGWTELDRKNWDGFNYRMTKQSKKWDLLGIHYAKDQLEKPSATDFFNHVKIGEWKPAQIKGDFQAVEWSLGDRVKNTGEIEVVMLYKKGAKGIDIQSVALYEDGNEVAKDSHTGFSGAKLTNIAYKLKLNTFNPNAKYSIKAVIKGSAGTDSYGEVKLQVQ